MKIKPYTLRKANEYVREHHRHSKTVVGCKFCIAAVDEEDQVIGVAIVGRPVARRLDDGYVGEIVRTPLGGFINHANDPNCVKVELRMTNHDDPQVKFDYKKWNLITIRDINKGEEITLKYTFYNIGQAMPQYVAPVTGIETGSGSSYFSHLQIPDQQMTQAQPSAPDYE